MKVQVNRTIIFVVLVTVILVVGYPANASGIVSTSMEIELGREVRDELLAESTLWEDEADNGLIAEMAEVLVPLIETRELEYEFYIIDDEQVNAFALPGGILFIYTGLLDFCERDPGMIAGVLAHEISHVARRHHKDSIEDALLGSLGMGILLQVFGLDEDWHAIAGTVVYTLIAQGHSRENEYDADEQAVRITYEAGWDPDAGIIQFLRAIEEEYGSGNELGDVGRCIASHPDTDRRVYFSELYLEELKTTQEFHPRPMPQYEELKPDDAEQEVEETEERTMYDVYRRKN